MQLQLIASTMDTAEDYTLGQSILTDLVKRLSEWMVVVAFIGYPLVGLIGTASNVEGRTVSYGFRIAVFGLSAAVLLFSDKSEIPIVNVSTFSVSFSDFTVTRA